MKGLVLTQLRVLLETANGVVTVVSSCEATAGSRVLGQLQNLGPETIIGQRYGCFLRTTFLLSLFNQHTGTGADESHRSSYIKNIHFEFSRHICRQALGLAFSLSSTSLKIAFFSIWICGLRGEQTKR